MKSIYLYLYILVSILAVTPGLLFSQAARDSVSLEPITISETRLAAEENYQPVQVQRVGQARLSQFTGLSIGRILEEHTTLTIRTNGPGGLSLPSSRGFSSRQTQVSWNGVSLSHPMLGLADLSLIPTSFLTQADYVPGNSGTAFGSGAAGGTLFLSSEPEINRGMVFQTLGAFGKQTRGAQYSYGRGQWSGSLMAEMEDSDNDFEFDIRRFDPEAGEVRNFTETRENNRYQSAHLMGQVQYKSGPFKAEGMIWWFDVDNNLPGGILSQSEQTRQKDGALRIFNTYTFTGNTNKFRLQAVYHEQELDFFDQAADIESLSKTKTAGTEVQWMRKLSRRISITQRTSYFHSRAEATNLSESPTQQQIGHSIQLTWQPWIPLHLFSSARYDYFEIAGDGFSAAVGTNWEVVKDHLYLKTQTSRNFVAPTLNDLFWVPGGNKDLKSETNLKTEAGILMIQEGGLATTKIEITGYYAKLYDGIRWLPDASNQNIFRPLNIDEILSRGVELQTSQEWKTGEKTQLSTSFSMARTRATIEKDPFDNNRTVGKQLVYVPQWQIQATVDVSRELISAGFNYQWNSERFTTQDHSSPFDPLPSHEISSFYTGVTFPMYATELQFLARVQNLFDENYQVIRNFPMPGRHLILTAKLTF